MNQQNQSNPTKDSTPTSGTSVSKQGASGSIQTNQASSPTSSAKGAAGAAQSSNSSSNSAMNATGGTSAGSQAGGQSTQASGQNKSLNAGDRSENQTQKHPQQNAILEPLAKFEEAITGFAGTLGETRQNIETVVDLTLRSKDELVHIKDAFMPYLTDARDVTQKVATRVRSTPSPVIWTVAGLIGSFLVWSLYSGKSTHSSKAKGVLH